jgi:hypothetical protein
MSLGGSVRSVWKAAALRPWPRRSPVQHQSAVARFDEQGVGVEGGGSARYGAIVHHGPVWSVAPSRFLNVQMPVESWWA